MRFRVCLLAVGILTLTSWAGCSGCDGGGFADAGPDGPIVGSTFSLSWSLVDSSDGTTHVSCDKLDPNATVVVTATRVSGGGTGGVESLNCGNLQGTSTLSLAPGTYDFSYELHGTLNPSTPIATATAQNGVVISAGRPATLNAIVFNVNPNGRLVLMLRIGSSGNCAAEGGPATGFAISLEHAGGAGDTGCAPEVFTLSGGGTYNANDCSAPVVGRCISSTETLTIATLPSGTYQIHVRGKKGTLECWRNDDTLRVPPQAMALTATLNLAATGAAGCP